ncbi:MAG: primosomal protein N', partial [Lachnospiraceae bacterium]|nr:primosomal protein N' [Lachnospiraceae bacterium]
GVSLLHGITGSGKTEVYMELIEKNISMGKQAIVLIPEIALTFQTLMRFYARFGDRVSVLHSRLSDGERYDQYERARTGQLDVMIGPRSALFTPFMQLGLIVIDEEHENSYKSEKMPKYHAREVAEYIAKRDHAALVLGSATPSLESYYRALKGEYRLYELKYRPQNAVLPQVYIADMRKELKEGNKSFFSRKLKELMLERLLREEQIMLFINRRGYAGFVSCRECGYVVKCPHCDVSLSQHHGNGMYQKKEQKLICHYCGYQTDMLMECPECGSPYIAGFRAGTQRIEEELKKWYPSVRVLRMDADTTRKKEDYEKILSSFAAHEADVLIGTQMIVKGHDFPNTTLVGAIAADLSLSVGDYRAAERTFQLLTQAAGRAG